MVVDALLLSNSAGLIAIHTSEGAVVYGGAEKDQGVSVGSQASALSTPENVELIERCETGGRQRRAYY
jgi:hypothetical protein